MAKKRVRRWMRRSAKGRMARRKDDINIKGFEL